jgi:N-acetylmuramoyl-L-alanine amidase
MRIFFSLILVLLFSDSLMAQDYYERARKNLPILIKHPSLYDQIWLDTAGVTIYASALDRVIFNAEARIEWDEVPAFLDMMQKYPLKQAVEIYQHKGVGSFPDSVSELKIRQHIPQNLKGLRVALDPGHLAGSRREARMEARMMEISGKKYGVRGRMRFYEADLAYKTALILKNQLEAAGAEVLISREEGESALGIRFKHWYRKCFEGQLEWDYERGNIDDEFYQYLKNEATKKDVFWRYFKRKDFEARARKINAWNPDVTLIIHYNAHGSGELEAHEENYSMAFVGGGFTRNELSNVEARMEFLRLLLSDDVANSVKLSSNFVSEHKEELKISPVPVENELPYLNRSSVFTGIPGVYARNLFMSRAIHGTLCYGESLMQENILEAQALDKKDYREDGIKTSMRVKQVADAYFQAVQDFVNTQQD